MVDEYYIELFQYNIILYLNKYSFSTVIMFVDYSKYLLKYYNYTVLYTKLMISYEW